MNTNATARYVEDKAELCCIKPRFSFCAIKLHTAIKPCIVSSAVGNICSAGNKNPNAPVSLNSNPKEYLIPIVLKKSILPPPVGYNILQESC